MNKKIQLALIIVILLIVCVGGYLVYYSLKKTPTQTITYLVSRADPIKYCNGADMDSAGYRTTITTEESTSTREVKPTLAQTIKTVIAAATTGMCYTAMDQLAITENNGIIYIPPIDAWAGVSITMCSCKPQVEVNLLRIPGITKVVWSTAPAQACTQEAKLCLDGSAVGRTGQNCEFAPCPQTSGSAL